MKHGDIEAKTTDVRLAVQEDLWTAMRKVMRARYVFLGVRADQLSVHLEQAVTVVLDRGAEGFGFVAAQVRPFDVAVITVASVEPERQAPGYLGVLLDALQRLLRDQGVESLAQVGYAPWLTEVLVSRGFVSREEIVTYEWRAQPVSVQGNDDVQISTAQQEDLPQLVQMDSVLFGPVWHKGTSEFSVSYERAFLFTVARLGGRIVGYQWCDRAGERAHLTRLAVDSAWQRRGIGTRLLTDTLRRLVQSGVKLVSLNTQSENFCAQDLYRHHGFYPLEERVNLWWRDL